MHGKARRSTIAASILAKAQQASDARLNSTNTPQKSRLDSLKESNSNLTENENNGGYSSGQESVNDELLPAHSSIVNSLVKDAKELSTSCSNIEKGGMRNSYLNKMADKVQTLSHKSLDD